MTTSRAAPCEWHVSLWGNDASVGSSQLPLRSIQRAAERAIPGDTICIHAGTYRERIDPPRGGGSEEERITFCAAGDGPVVIKGSEVVEGWKASSEAVWSVEVENALFGQFHPYRETIRGHWFYDRGRGHHPGAVYLDGHWLVEAASLEELCRAPAEAQLWFAEVGLDMTTFFARFGGQDPGDAMVEIAVRQSVFYPSEPGKNFISVRGLTMVHAATPWAPPTTEQIGLIGSHWSRGWVIEDCVIRYSACAGITLGKYNDPEDFPEQPVVEHTTGEDTFHGTIRRAIAHGWKIGEVGDHVVRNNMVSHCEMAGICGSFGALRSRIEGNVVHDIHRHHLFHGFEQAGIKFHGAIDAQISCNRIFRCQRGIWLDWMSQGARVAQNICFENGPEPDFFSEVNHGPMVVDRNQFLSPWSLLSMSEGTAYIGNIFLGRVDAKSELTRFTPYFKAHSTEIAGWKNIELGDDRFFCNVFAESKGARDFDQAVLTLVFSDNLYLNGAKPTCHEIGPRNGGHVAFLERDGDGKIVLPGWLVKEFPPVPSSSLGAPALSGLPFF
jgi:alpha-L-arabinofuranosidase